MRQDKKNKEVKRPKLGIMPDLPVTGIIRFDIIRANLSQQLTSRFGPVAAAGVPAVGFSRCRRS